jgi:hypothetical protein
MKGKGHDGNLEKDLMSLLRLQAGQGEVRLSFSFSPTFLPARTNTDTSSPRRLFFLISFHEILMRFRCRLFRTTSNNLASSINLSPMNTFGSPARPSLNCASPICSPTIQTSSCTPPSTPSSMSPRSKPSTAPTQAAAFSANSVLTGSQRNRDTALSSSLPLLVNSPFNHRCTKLLHPPLLPPLRRIRRKKKRPSLPHLRLRGVCDSGNEGAEVEGQPGATSLPRRVEEPRSRPRSPARQVRCCEGPSGDLS